MLKVGFRTYKQTDVAVPDVLYFVHRRLDAVFSNAALFGGCIREPQIGSHPINDIDARVQIDSEDVLPKELIAYLRAGETDVWRRPDERLKAIFQDWTGFGLRKVMTQGPYYRMTCTVGRPNAPEIDLSLYREFGKRANKTPFAIAPMLNGPAPFSAAAMDRSGIWADVNFERDTDEMRFSIYRDRGLRPVIWDISYYERMRERYPDLKLTNIEARLYLRTQQVANAYKEWRSAEPSLPR